MQLSKIKQFSFLIISFLLLFTCLLFLFSCNKIPEQKSSNPTNQIKQSLEKQQNLSNYRDTCIQVAKLWLKKNDLENLIDKFESEQKDQSKIDHSINYSIGKFNVSEISSSSQKYSVSYSNASTNATFVISWVVDFAERRVYANPNEYGYDKTGVAF